MTGLDRHVAAYSTTFAAQNKVSLNSIKESLSNRGNRIAGNTKSRAQFEMKFLFQVAKGPLPALKTFEYDFYARKRTAKLFRIAGPQLLTGLTSLMIMLHAKGDDLEASKTIVERCPALKALHLSGPHHLEFPENCIRNQKWLRSLTLSNLKLKIIKLLGTLTKLEVLQHLNLTSVKVSWGIHWPTRLVPTTSSAEVYKWVENLAACALLPQIETFEMVDTSLHGRWLTVALLAMGRLQTLRLVFNPPKPQEISLRIPCCKTTPYLVEGAVREVAPNVKNIMVKHPSGKSICHGVFCPRAECGHRAYVHWSHK